MTGTPSSARDSMVWRYSSTGGWCSTGTEWARATEDSGTNEPSTGNHCVRHLDRESTGRARGSDGVGGSGQTRSCAQDPRSGKVRGRRTVEQFLEELHAVDHPWTRTGKVRV